MEFQQLLKRIKDLGLPEGEFALFGSAPIVVRGIRPFSHDIDMIVSEKVWNEYAKKPEWQRTTFERDGKVVEMLENNLLELYKVWGPGEWDIEALLQRAEIINGLPFVSLNDVLQWKEISARDKDLKDVELIKKYLGC